MVLPWQEIWQFSGTATQISCSSYRDILSQLSFLLGSNWQEMLNLSPAGAQLAQGTEFPRSPMKNWKPGVYQERSRVTSKSPLERAYLTIARTVLNETTYCSPLYWSVSKDLPRAVQFQVELWSPQMKKASSPLFSPLDRQNSLAQLSILIVMSLYLYWMALELMRSQWLRWSLRRGPYRVFIWLIISDFILRDPAQLFNILWKMLSQSSVSLGWDDSMRRNWVKVKAGTTSGAHSRKPCCRVRFLVKQEGSSLLLAKTVPVLLDVRQPTVQLKRTPTLISPIVTLAFNLSRYVSV